MEFSERSKQVLKYADQIGKKLGAQALDTQHLLYGLARCEGSVSKSLLERHGITHEDIKKSFEARSEALRKVKVSGKLKYTPQVNKILDLSKRMAEELGANSVGTEHILYCVLSEDNSIAYNVLGYLLKDTPFSVSKIMEEIAADLDFEDDEHLKEEFVGPDEIPVDGESSDFKLQDFTDDITQRALEGKLDPVIGRNEEILRVIQILARRSKNNPCLIGQPGVGKTAIVKGLAQRIATGGNDVPDLIRNKKILSLDMSALVAGTQYRGEFEKRLNAVIDEVSQRGDIILFMDEIHTLIGAGSAKGTLDAANILKPALSRGDIQLIGATTEEEFRKYFEKDAALERRFQPVSVSEPGKEDTLEILMGIKDKFEKHHHVVYEDDAIEECVTLSERYITDRRFPDKAIDVMDEAASLLSVKVFKPSYKIEDLKEKIAECDRVIKDSIHGGELEKASESKAQQDELYIELRKAEASEKKKKERRIQKVTVKEVETVISRWSKVPVSELSVKESERLLKLENNLHKRIIGQNEAVEAVSKAIRRGRTGISDPNRPIGSFVFLGPTGVGKTELSKALAAAVFGSEDNLIRVDMSEYMEAHSVSKILGSPPGYVGFDEGGQLSERVRKNPYSVVLFDEIEKAHPDIFNVLLQILDDGMVTDSQGRKVNFKNTIIIMTSNVGAKRITEPKNLGFNSRETAEQNYEKMKSNVMEEVKQLFKPEFINRIDDFIVFHKLGRKELEDITALLLSNLSKRAKENMQIKLIFADELKNHIVDKYSNPLMGARPLRRGIMTEIEDSLASEILSGRISKGKSVRVSYENEKIKFD
ncbi:MAG: ATP-dependent Clp protease ATP-binding subunit [Lachnospiraceae bacterium]|nr:ATP-dependent Clp protease ATP-binding subunit [Lachnospiraceae bacterium]